VTIRPPAGSADAMQIDEYPVNVPTSSTRLARSARTRNARKRPSSGPTIICGAVVLARVSSASRSSTSPGGSVCASA
jgi:hypothetical protein